MKAICPNNKNHDRFGTVVTVLQDWEVDSEGNLIEVLDKFVETVHKPDPDNIWTCMECGAQAIIK